MQTETTLSPTLAESNSTKSLAHYLLTAERVLMGVILVACGVGGFFNLVTHATGAESAAQVSGTLLKTGFLFPLLKGAEVLLQVYVNKARE